LILFNGKVVKKRGVSIEFGQLSCFNGKVVKKRGVSIEFGQLSCFYVNARNLMNKLDLFKAWVQGAQT